MGDTHDAPYGEDNVIERLRQVRSSAPKALVPALDHAIELAERAEAETQEFMSPYSDKAWSDIVHYPKLCWLLAEGVPR